MLISASEPAKVFFAISSKIGLEKAFENDLIGSNGIQRYEVNAYGKRINQIDHLEGKKGKNLRLTIDAEIQKLANELLIDKSYLQYFLYT